jgi:type I restriction enzyme M protein
MTTTSDIVAKLWNLCNVLKDDGVTYQAYVTELTYLLFLKMAKETETERRLTLVRPRPDGAGTEEISGTLWRDLVAASAPTRLQRYEDALRDYGRYGKADVQLIYANASTFIKKPATLSTLVSEIDKLDWFSARREGLGELYEGLLEKNANEKKSGAGQYFTPRPLIASMVALMKPAFGDIIQDPAAGTGGFLIAANAAIREHREGWTDTQQRQYAQRTFYGMEHVQDAHRLALMNLLLHEIECTGDSGIHYGDTLSPDGQKLPLATLILTNPPFGTKKGGGLPSRDDFTYPTSNKQFCFLQHIYRGLKVGGRAAVVLPDNVLFESGVGRQIRADLMDKCNLHTILRLPTGIFYAQGVKTNVLFFTRGTTDRGNTKEVWVYDLRANMPQFGKRTQLSRETFSEFEAAFGDDPLGTPASLAMRVDTGEAGRFRRFTREEIAARGDNLDISWLRDEDGDDPDDLPEPAELAQEAMTELQAALEELQSILEELGEEVVE